MSTQYRVVDRVEAPGEGFDPAAADAPAVGDGGTHEEADRDDDAA